jgi:hypothetical protein
MTSLPQRADAGAKVRRYFEFLAKNESKLKIIAKIFGRKEKNIYLCNVRNDYPGDIPA